MQEIIVLLQQIRDFLNQHIHLHNSSQLLQKVSSQILNLQLNHSPSKLLQSSIYQQSSIHAPKIQLIDMFILNYNFQNTQYEIIPYPSSDVNNQCQNDRKALLNLLISKHKYHTDKIEKTQSMTELHQLTSNLPTCKPVLILPNYTQQNLEKDTNKYFYIYEESVCVESEGEYFLVDRYHIFCTLGLGYNTISMMSREVRQKIFSDRILLGHDSQNVNHEFVKNSLIQSLPGIYEEVMSKKLKMFRADFKESPPVSEVSEKQIKYRSTFFSVSKLCKLSTLLFFCALMDYKIIFLITKSKKHLLTQIVVSLQQSIHPLKFVFPIVFASMTDEHMEYLESPVPLMIGLWGSQHKVANFSKYRDNMENSPKLKEEQKCSQSLKEIIIDLQKLQVAGFLNILGEELFCLQKLNYYIQKYGRGLTIENKLNRYLSTEILSGNEEIKAEWSEIFNKKIRESQNYHAYLHSKNT